MNNSGIFALIRDHTYTNDKCFLCGCILDETNKTAEHVIPKWLIRKFNLWNEHMTLLNGRLVPYRSLTIPCCFDCNNIHLSPFEKEISIAINGGFEVFEKIDKLTLFYWLGKIYLGLLYYELYVDEDPRNPEKGTITNPEYLKSFYTLLLFLQGIRGLHRFENCFPASIFLFATQKPAEVSKQWDFKDSQQKAFIAIRIADIGIFAALQDGGVTQHMEDLLDHHKDIALHPLQFNEMTAKILYKLILLKVTPTFINVETKKESLSTMIPLSQTEDIFEEWEQDEYAQLLSHFTHIPVKECQPAPGQIYTWLNDEKGVSRFIPLSE